MRWFTIIIFFVLAAIMRPSAAVFAWMPLADNAQDRRAFESKELVAGFGAYGNGRKRDWRSGYWSKGQRPAQIELKIRKVTETSITLEKPKIIDPGNPRVDSLTGFIGFYISIDHQARIVGEPEGAGEIINGFTFRNLQRGTPYTIIVIARNKHSSKFSYHVIQATTLGNWTSLRFQWPFTGLLGMGSPFESLTGFRIDNPFSGWTGTQRSPYNYIYGHIALFSNYSLYQYTLQPGFQFNDNYKDSIGGGAAIYNTHSLLIFRYLDIGWYIAGQHRQYNFIGDKDKLYPEEAQDSGPARTGEGLGVSQYSVEGKSISGDIGLHFSFHASMDNRDLPQFYLYAKGAPRFIQFTEYYRGGKTNFRILGAYGGAGIAFAINDMANSFFIEYGYQYISPSQGKARITDAHQLTAGITFNGVKNKLPWE